MRTNNRYTFFFKQASNYDSEWGNFAGAFHKINEDEDVRPLYDQPPQSHNNPRELHDNPREVHSIPFKDGAYEPLKTRPIPSGFNIQCYK